MCPRLPKTPKVPGSWNFGSRPNLGQLKTFQSLILEILIFKEGSGWSSVKISHLVVHTNIRRLSTSAHAHENLTLGLFFGPF